MLVGPSPLHPARYSRILPFEFLDVREARIAAPLECLVAVHLASALMLAEDLEGIVTYDARLDDAARAFGLTVVAPR